MILAAILVLGMLQAGGQPPAEKPATATLDTVKVRAAKYSDVYAKEFDDRRLIGHGRYFTAADLERRNLTEITDLFKAVPGVQLDDNRIKQRGLFPDRLGNYSCDPSIFINGGYIGEDIPASIIDAFMQPSDALGIEVYSVGTVPAPYQRMTGCGAILFWTKDPRDIRRRRWSGGRLLIAALTIGSVVAVSKALGPK